ncbi:acetyl-CoA synthetase-like protein [Thelephora ganbajun]|uniref:Acetyl-CoA synthetase-like protein n=1 Tax=Thelephora ganbajun TaxID=370292 RepID=A0ACB6ZUJ4_THEGA|nr:acetyl-CoA synthetase-like protein [Thelephora ganbajun]
MFSHLTALDNHAATHADAPAFKLPQMSTHGGSSQSVEAWIPVSYRRFRDDVEHFAKYWITTFQRAGIAPRSCIGIWIDGMTYQDVLHVFGVSRAGYIPQLLHFHRSSSKSLVVELLRHANSLALICDVSHAQLNHDSSSSFASLPIPVYANSDLRQARVPGHCTLSKVEDLVADPNAVAFVLHTTGTTLGTPKLVPYTHRTVDLIMRRAQVIAAPTPSRRQDTYAMNLSICHYRGLVSFFGSLIHAACIAQPTRRDFCSVELGDMIQRAGVNKLHTTATQISVHIRDFRHNPNILHGVRGLEDITHHAPLNREDEEWLVQNRIPFSCTYGTTEVPLILRSARDSRTPSSTFMQLIDSRSVTFVPISSSGSSSSTLPSSVYKNVNTNVLELVIPATSPDCPHPSVRQSEDGHFHTGDLFLEVVPGHYTFRGRMCEWIRSSTGLWYDAKMIEENVLKSCPDLLVECIAVGNGRPSPVVLIELGPGAATFGGADSVKREVYRRIRHFQSRRLAHERIGSVESFVIVQRSAWPRTSVGHIRRTDAEQKFQRELDRVYAAASAR